MSLDVAIQSVAFYILSCSTCSKISHRRKAKVQAKKERAEKQALETEQPGLYRHPSPFSTNPYWTEEIMMGPGLPKKKGGDKNACKNSSQRALNTAGQGSSYAGSTGMSTEAPSSPTAATEGSRLSGEGWNRKRYQREDEALWGIDFQGSGQKIKEAIAKAGESANRFVGGRLNKSGSIKEDSEFEEDSAPYYITSRNPPVNDLHPPVVSTQPLSKDETRWMLQPPPSAKVMEGKVRVNSGRSRTNSDGSTIKNTLSRQITDKTLDSKSQRADTPSSRGTSRGTSRAESRKKTKVSRPRIQRHDSMDSISSPSSSPTPRKKKPTPLSIPRPVTQDFAEHIPVPAPVATTEMRERNARPLLTTIVSSSMVVPKVQNESGDENLSLREFSQMESAKERTSSPSLRVDIGEKRGREMTGLSGSSGNVVVQ
ncbi:hypothetical protein GLAREA_06770 [Glarea lozoyensis ATCC 20868]|uniref:Signal peptide-containing protein n=1 Tax=Glarea lozoyensis (strain ATCC 20868 / MF5171) TaxID=1116229 RepID=S3D5M8_GLAL2|nr:uncharacterized protein GLAREA_06770 [Glarea lozoyensis ATCC 20868]EPE33757.1 hypothetical protein GLAREA_06770 [Glarea lozoyensis ATCC 20868]